MFLEFSILAFTSVQSFRNIVIKFLIRLFSQFDRPDIFSINSAVTSFLDSGVSRNIKLVIADSTVSSSCEESSNVNRWIPWLRKIYNLFIGSKTQSSY